MHLQITTAVLLSDLPVATAQIENERARLVFLRMIYQEIRENRLTRAWCAEEQGSQPVPFMQIEVIRRCFVCFEHDQVLAP